MIDIVFYWLLSIIGLSINYVWNHIYIELGCNMKTSQDYKMGNDFFWTLMLLYSYLLQPFNAVACHFNDKGK